MLMNIILRPGGGDKDHALPRPKVEVSSEGANIILVRLTFPENENIQGLRAFTPTDPEDLEKFDELRNAISAESHGNIERLTAVSSEELGSSEQQTASQSVLLKPRNKGSSFSSTKTEHVVSNPTRPTRPPKEVSRSALRQGKKADGGEKPSLAYLPPPGASPPKEKLEKLSSGRARQSKTRTAAGSQWNKFQRMDQESGDRREEAGAFAFAEEVNEIFSDSKLGRIKPRTAQEKPAIYYPAYEPFRPEEAVPSNREVREFLSISVAGDNNNNNNNREDTILGLQAAIIPSNDHPVTPSPGTTGPAVHPDSLVLYNTTPPPLPALSVSSSLVLSQPPRPAHPPPPRAARTAASPPRPRGRSSPPFGGYKAASANPWSFLVPGGLQEKRDRQHPRIEVRTAANLFS